MQVKGYDGPVRAVLIDVGTADDYLEDQLKPQAFADAAKGNSKVKLELRLQAWPLPWQSPWADAVHAVNSSCLLVGVVISMCKGSGESSMLWCTLSGIFHRLTVLGAACRMDMTTPTSSCQHSLMSTSPYMPRS